MAKMILKIVLAGMVLFFVMVFGGLYLVFKTPLPLTFLQKLVNSPTRTVQWDSVEGSLNQGFVFSNFQFKDSDNEAKFQRLAVTYKTDSLSSGLEALIVTEISAENGKVRYKNIAKKKTDTAGQGSSTSTTPTTSRRSQKKNNVNITFQKVLLSNIEVISVNEVGLEKTFKIANFSVSDLGLTALENSISVLLKQFNLETSLINAKGGQIEGSFINQNTSLMIKNPIDVTLKKDILPTHLSADLAIKVLAEHSKDKTHIQIELLDGSIVYRLDKDTKEWVLESKDLQLSKYITNSPVDSLSFSQSHPETDGFVALVPNLFSKSPKQIQLKIGSTNFIQSENNSVASTPANEATATSPASSGVTAPNPLDALLGTKSMVLEAGDLVSVQSPSSLVSWGISLFSGGKAPLFKAIKSQKSDPMNTLSQIYFLKPLNDTSEEEKTILTQKLALFDFSATSFATQTTPLKKTPQTGKSRQPASKVVKKIKRK